MTAMLTPQVPASRPPLVEICGVQIAAVGLDAATELMLGSSHGVPRPVHLCNAYTLSLALRSEEFRAMLNGGGVNFADGHPVALLGRRAGNPQMSERVYGPDLMRATLDRGRSVGLRHFLYGGDARNLDTLVASLGERYPGITIVGAEAPTFQDLSTEESKQLCERVVRASPDVVWVGLGTPRQNEFASRHAETLGATVVGVGAAFDFLAGTKRQAPLWMQQHGLEWLFRLAHEPRRLWRRYLFGLPVFALGAAHDLRAQRRRRTRQ